MHWEVAKPEELKRVAHWLRQRYPHGAAIALQGELGVGKTTLVRAFVALLAEQNQVPIPRVVSPTFSFHQSYPELYPPIEHFDLYRLDQASESTLTEVGLLDALYRRKEAFVFVEWPDKAAASLPFDVRLVFSLRVQGKREIAVCD